MDWLPAPPGALPQRVDGGAGVPQRPLDAPGMPSESNTGGRGDAAPLPPTRSSILGLPPPLCSGGIPSAHGRWPLVAVGPWPLAVGRWPLAVGRWPLAVQRVGGHGCRRGQAAVSSKARGLARPGRSGQTPPTASMAMAMSASGERNPNATRVSTRILVLVDSTSACEPFVPPGDTTGSLQAPSATNGSRRALQHRRPGNLRRRSAGDTSGPSWRRGRPGARTYSVMALMRSAISLPSGSAPPTMPADCRARSLVMSPSTLIRPPMNAVITAWGSPSTRIARAVA